MKHPKSDNHPSWWLSLTLSLATSLWGQFALAEKPKLAIIIDDLGYHQRGCQDVLTLPGPLNLAYLPHTPHVEEYARLAHQAGHTVMLHLPMASHSLAKLGPGGLEDGMSGQHLKQIMLTSLDSVPHATGFNNHMGSLLTEVEAAMKAIMAVAKDKQLFFVDSRTTVKTVAQDSAIASGIPNIRRHVFLDNDTNEAALEKQFNQALRRARKKGLTVIIGHPYPETLAFLKSRLTELEGQIELISLSQELKYSRPFEDSSKLSELNQHPTKLQAQNPAPAATYPCSWCTLDHVPVDLLQIQSDSQPAPLLPAPPMGKASPEPVPY